MSKTSLFFIAIGITIAILLFVMLRPQPVESPTEEIDAPTGMGEQLPTQPAGMTFDIVIEDGKIVQGDETINVTEGDTLILRVTSDVNEELHVHGYDEAVQLEKGRTATLTFVADVTGRFPFELEESRIDLGVIEVQPK